MDTKFRTRLSQFQFKPQADSQNNLKSTDIIESIITYLKNERRFLAVDALIAIRNELKTIMNEDKRHLVNVACLYLLTEKPKTFLYTTSNTIVGNVFEGVPFIKLQEFVKLADFIKNDLPPACVNLLLKRPSLSGSDPITFSSVCPIKADKYFYKSLSNHENVEHSISMIVPPVKPMEDNWLEERYNDYKALMPGLSLKEFSESVLQSLKSQKSDDELQNDLIEMLGFDMFELIAELLNNRKGVINIGCKVPPVCNQNNVKKEMPVQLRRLQELVNRLKAIPETNKHVISTSGASKPRLHDELLTPHVHDEQIDVARKMMICGKVANVPFDAKQKHNELYDEITIPPRNQRAVDAYIEPIRIETLDTIGRMVFKDIETFNKIQSEVFDVAYNTNENMLVCAPTGAGKTNIALMSIVNQIKKYISGNVFQIDKFKIIYICPMKALAAEMAQNFSRKLACLGLTVKELTGDIQMSRKEILETQMLVTTPEKWDVISRKGTADAELTSLVKLLIIDEVHLLNTDRGPVIEALVARTLRQVITSQNMIRIIGLSATLPSYRDVAQFLRVNPQVGLFFFDNRYRSVPLVQTFVGLKTTKLTQIAGDLDEACFDKVTEFLKDGHQVLVFVHARNQTVRTANFLKETAGKRNMLALFAPTDTIHSKKARWEAANSPNKIVEELLGHGLGVHHAGMLRRDRSETEKQFIKGAIKVLVCTATLAWGVNLPAHGVVIKGTEIYDSKRGSYKNLDILDVLQIFGRAGRPQYDTSGHGIIITTNDRVQFYLSALTNQLPIESNLMQALPDNLNAEVVLGTIANIQEAVEWLTFTYMYRRMLVNPHVYGLLPKDLYEDPCLRGHLLELAHTAAHHLDKAHMVRYDTKSGELTSTYLGRTASYFYVTLSSIQNFNERITPYMTIADIVFMMCSASEFNDMQVRPDELDDLDYLLNNYCEFPIMDAVENASGKVFVLMQTFLSRNYIKSVSLASDMEYINQSSVRIARALFDISIHRNSPVLAARCLKVAQAFEQQMWPLPTQSPMRQFRDIPLPVIEIIESRNISFSQLLDMDVKEIGMLVRNHRIAHHLKQCIDSFPAVEVESTLHPITRGVLRVKLFITPNFVWNDKWHGNTFENFWIWVEDPENDTIYHSETCAISKSVCIKKETLELVFTVPLVEPCPSQYLLRISSDRWMYSEHLHSLSFRDLHIPSSYTPHTELLELRPLSIKALSNPVYEGLYKFSHFNPVQTQIFHCLFHRDDNVLLGAPTGSGKTIAAELCMFRLFNKNQDLKVVYIAPLKALVRERVEDWKRRFGVVLGKNVVEITGDVTPSAQVIKSADIIITTPEKWDGMSRGWQNRRYIQKVGLIIIDEIHLLGESRGPVLEVIVSRTNFIANQTGIKPRIIGLSTAIANAGNLANWLGIGEIGLYNFRPSVRPVPLDTHIMGFPGKHYCPRMLSMNRPTYQSIRQFAPNSPTLVFCSSRKQTRLTATDLITYLLTDADSKRWLHCEEDVMEYITSTVIDSDLKHFLHFGIAIHHAGLQERDRKTVEELFINQKIQVLIATATLAWGVNFPAHLVIIKGTEYFDGKTKRYIDMPITDVLQMMGRAGRPQYDTSGVACVFVHDVKKNFYKKFLYEPFPIESNLTEVLPDHISAEIASGTISSKTNLMEYMTWTYFFRRLLENPSYYNLDNVEPTCVQKFLSGLVDAVVDNLVESNCVAINDKDMQITYETTFFGQIASFYYLSYKSMVLFQHNIKWNSTIMELFQTMCRTEEYATFPVRHYEDVINKEIALEMSYDLNGEPCDSSHVKVALLMHAHLIHFEMPNQEYVVDLKSALDQALRILQAMTDIASNNSWLSCTLKIIHIMQMLIQGQYMHTPVLLTFPHVTPTDLSRLEREIKKHPKEIRGCSLLSLKIASMNHRKTLEQILRTVYEVGPAKEILTHICNMPLLDLTISIPSTGQKFAKDKIEPLVLTAGQDYEIVMHFNKLGAAGVHVSAPRFPKKKDEGWFVVLGDIENDYLIQIKRVSIVKNYTCSLSVTVPKPGNHIFTVFLISDSYLGLDQQYNIPVTTVEEK